MLFLIKINWSKYYKLKQLFTKRFKIKKSKTLPIKKIQKDL